MKALTDTRVARLKELYAQTESLADSARQLPCSKATASKYLKGICTKKPASRRLVGRKNPKCKHKIYASQPPSALAKLNLKLLTPGYGKACKTQLSEIAVALRLVVLDCSIAFAHSGAKNFDILAVRPNGGLLFIQVKSFQQPKRGLPHFRPLRTVGHSGSVGYSAKDISAIVAKEFSGKTRTTMTPAARENWAKLGLGTKTREKPS